MTQSAITPIVTGIAVLASGLSLMSSAINTFAHCERTIYHQNIGTGRHEVIHFRAAKLI